MPGEGDLSVAMKTTQAGHIAVDARSLQDPNYASRGVGRHATNLLRHVPRASGRRLIAICDPEMPPLSSEAAHLFDDITPNALAAKAFSPACLVSPSPMTHDPLFIARLLTDRTIQTAAVIYDFIPFEGPDRYLTRAADRHAYFTCLAWLGAYDLFLPISHASAIALRRLVRSAMGNVAVTGAAVDAAFASAAGAAPAPPRHVLVVGGGDPRKNVESSVRAHAASRAAQSAALPLVITGNYPQDQAESFRLLAQSCGGSPRFLQMPGHVSEAALIELYRAAFCVIGPSRAEGFDLPLAEGMACGVPAIASDIPAHRELVASADWRFDPDDAPRLAGLIDRLIGNPEIRLALIREQAPVGKQFQAAAVARRFWQPVIDRLERLVPAPAILRRQRPKMAFMSPLPPSASGVADYTAATCEELGKLVDLHLFTTTDSPIAVAGAATPAPMSALPNLSATFDTVVNVIGNHAPLHKQIFDQLLRYGGDCIAHDSRMAGFYGELGMHRATGLASRELGRNVTQEEITRWLDNEETLEAMFLGEITDAAKSIMVHSAPTARLIAQRFGVTPALLPFCVYRPLAEDRLQARGIARQRLGIGDTQIVIASFGIVHKTKAPWDCVWAIDLLRGWGIDASLHFIGGYAEGCALRETVHQLGLLDHVKFLNEHVTEECYCDYLVAADLGIQLRKTNFGSLSGALMDCIAAGLPTVTNRSMAEAIESPRYVATVPDNLSPVLVAEALANLLDSGTGRAQTRDDRLAFSEAHSFRVYARKLVNAVGLDAA